MDANTATLIVRGKVAADPGLNAKLAASWNEVCDAIEKRALAARPKPKVFEVHHETQVARAAFLIDVAGDAELDAAKQTALAAVGL